MLTLRNTLTRKKENFEPLEGKNVRMYNCGPTVYDYAHIGNLRAYVFADVLRRTLEYEGFTVTQVMNLTDIGHLQSDADEGEDKMVAAVRRLGKPETLESLEEVGTIYAEAFKADLQKLNVEMPREMPRASDHLKEQIGLIKTLEEKGFAYRTPDGVYFDTSTFPKYGALGGVQEGDQAGARVELNSAKRNPRDFVLWKLSDKIGWEDNPWGKGFPGWHIECSAMSTRYLGQPFDIHTGGIEHIPIHHNNEIAQSEAAAGVPLARFWLHNEHLLMESGKMSKSAGTFITLKDIEARGISPLALRYFFLGAHYRSPLHFTWEALEGAYTTLQKIIRVAVDTKEHGTTGTIYRNSFHEAMEDDLNTPRALATLWDILKDESLSPADKRATLLDLDRVLGLDLAHAESAVIPRETLPEHVRALIEEREEARKAKDWQKADELREEIRKAGFEIEDTEGGPALSTR